MLMIQNGGEETYTSGQKNKPNVKKRKHREIIQPHADCFFTFD